jgi:Domain of unknown function (DUF1824)
MVLFVSLLLLITANHSLCDAFLLNPKVSLVRHDSTLLHSGKLAAVTVTPERVTEASRILSDWDRAFSSSTIVTEAKDILADDTDVVRPSLLEAVRTLNQKAVEERSKDASQGRCMLGICASSAAEGIAALKLWVTNLDLPRGLLHGMDVDGVPLELNGGVYIKYNSGGVYTFADIRKSQMGFNALWKPGDAMLEEYDGTYRGVYFQVELGDGEFRQYLLPHDLFRS